MNISYIGYHYNKCCIKRIRRYRIRKLNIDKYKFHLQRKYNLAILDQVGFVLVNSLTHKKQHHLAKTISP